MRYRKRAFCILVFLCSWIRVNSQVIYDSPPVGVSLTRPILPWLARYFVGAGKSNALLDGPQTAATDPNAKGIHQLYNSPMANYVAKPNIRRQEASEDGEKPDEKPDEDGEKPEEAKPDEEAKPEEAKPDEEAKPEEPPAETEAPKEEEKPEEPAPEPAKEEPVPEPPAETEAPKEDTTEAPQKDPPASPSAIPCIVPSTIPTQIPYGPFANTKCVQGMPANPPVSAPFYNMPSYIYYPAPLPSYPAAYPYPSPMVPQPTIAVPTTIQPPTLVTITFPPMPSPKPIVLETPTFPKNWPPMPEPIPITPVTLPTVTVQPIPDPKPILPVAVPVFQHVPFSMPAHSIVPFHSIAPPGSYLGQSYMAPISSSSIVSPKYFYRNIGNIRPPESPRHQVFLQTQPIYTINKKRQS